MKRHAAARLPTAAALLLTAAALSAACEGSGPGTGVEPDPTELTVVSGDGQSGVGGQTLSDSLVVRARGAAGGDPRAGETVRWAVTSSAGGSVSATETATDSAGRTGVRATLPDLEDATLRVEASLADGSSSVAFTATVERTASGADRLRRVSGDGQTGEPGAELAAPYVVQVQDAGGAAVAGVEVDFFLPEGEGGAVEAIRPVTDSAGRASAVATLPDGVGVTQTVRATAASLADTVAFTSETVAPAGRPAAVQVVSGDDQKGIARDTLADPIRVEVTDAEGAVVSGAVVRWSVASADGGSVARDTTVTGEDGQAANRWRLGEAAGALDSAVARIEPEEGSPDRATFTAEVTGPPESIVVEQGAIEEDDNATPEPETVVGDTVTVAPGFWSRRPFRVTVEDAAGRTVRGVALTWTVVDGGGTLGDEPEGSGGERLVLNTAFDGSASVWRRAPSGAEDGDWIGASLSLEAFPDVRTLVVDALVRP